MNRLLERFHCAKCFDCCGIPICYFSRLKNRPPGVWDIKPVGGHSFRGNWTAPGFAWHVVALADTWQATLIPYGGLPHTVGHNWRLYRQPLEAGIACEPTNGAQVPWLELQGQPARGAWAILWAQSSSPTLTWIMNGVVVEREQILSRGLGAWGGVAVAHGLRLDLSRAKLVRDEAYKNMKSWLEALVLAARAQ